MEALIPPVPPLPQAPPDPMYVVESLLAKMVVRLDYMIVLLEKVTTPVYVVQPNANPPDRR